jgi:hypothetical protein
MEIIKLQPLSVLDGFHISNPSSIRNITEPSKLIAFGTVNASNWRISIFHTIMVIQYHGRLLSNTMMMVAFGKL